jgi:predicted anti-sigma-YlaC factor YlaD
MDCELAREALSALLDGEAPGVGRAEVEQHLAGCPACRAWREAAYAVTRRARVGPARAAPPVDVSALVAAMLDRAVKPRRPAVSWTRWALVVVAVLQLAVTAPVLILGSDHDAPVHIAHEMGSFDLALAAGLLMAAWRPALAAGMRTVVGAAALLLMVTAAVDLAGGRTTVGDEAPHLLAVVGWLLLCRVPADTSTLQRSRNRGRFDGRWRSISASAPRLVRSVRK